MSKLIEEWRPVVDYEGLYEASDWGRIRSLDIILEVPSKNGKLYRRVHKGKLLKFSKSYRDDGTFYYRVVLTKDGVHKPYSVHVLVAKAFIPNPNNLPQVNHKDEDKTNNSIWNLEWCTPPYNTNYGTANERRSKRQINDPKRSKIVYQYTLDDELVNIWESTAECERNGFDASLISACCTKSKYRKTHKGYKWSYEPL